MGSTSPNLGFPDRTIASALFTLTQQRVLAILFGHPDKSFRRAEILQLAGGGTGAVHRELLRLEASGLVKLSAVGNQKHYKANLESPVFPELHGLIVKTVGLAAPIKSALAYFSGQIHEAFVYGSVARGSHTATSDVDLMVLADDLAYGELFDALHDAETAIRRKINPTLMSVSDWKRKLAEGSPFVTKVNSLPKIFLVGSAEHS